MKLSNYKYLFLDRDGVINKRQEGYVSSWDAFEYTEGALKAIVRFSKYFDRIIVVTNQQGVGKELMSQEQLDKLHEEMSASIEDAGGRIDAILACTELDSEDNNCRKPSPAMGLWAKRKFPEIDFSQAIMVGDSISDMKFGENLGMFTVLVGGKEEEAEKAKTLNVGRRIKKLADLASFL